MSTTAADYLGRRADVLVFQPGGAGAQTPTLALPGEGGRVCVGPVKVAQRWVLAFLQEAGTVPHRPAAGTGFVAAARAGRVRTAADAQALFGLAARQAARQVRAAEADADPADERLGEVELLAAGLLAGTLTLRVRVPTLAGPGREVVLPLPVTP